MGCGNHTASISWSPIPGAVTYTTTLEQINGSTTCCTTSDTSCDITDLPCGEMFILLVVAEGRMCNSSQSEGEIVRTGKVYVTQTHGYYLSNTVQQMQKCFSIDLSPSASCAPQNLKASLSCSGNIASMLWNYSRGLGQLYRVTAVSTDGHEDECISNNNRCDLMGLRCGQYYTATVTAEHRDCKSKPSDSLTIKTGMCRSSLQNTVSPVFIFYDKIS